MQQPRSLLASVIIAFTPHSPSSAAVAITTTQLALHACKSAPQVAHGLLCVSRRGKHRKAPGPALVETQACLPALGKESSNTTIHRCHCLGSPPTHGGRTATLAPHTSGIDQKLLPTTQKHLSKASVTSQTIAWAASNVDVPFAACTCQASLHRHISLLPEMSAMMNKQAARCGPVVKTPSGLGAPLLGRKAVAFTSRRPLAPALLVRASEPHGEDARPLARTVYDFPDWRKHRSPNRLIERLMSIQRSNILANISSSVAWCTSVAAIVTAYMYAFEQHDLPAWLPAIAPNPACNAFINTTSVALSLLLVFRTNTGYGRWNEARCMWGLLVNRSRDIMRQACTMMPADDPESKAAMARWMVAFTRCLRIHLQPEVTWQDELKNILKPEELDMLVKSSHKPVKCLHMMSQVIQSSNMNPILQHSLSMNITAFQDVLGGCERLLRAPIPVSYTRHTARFLFVWLTVLPFALYGTCGPATAPVTAAVAAVLCGIEEIGVQVEEPFGILPLEALCTRIQTDAFSTVADTNECMTIAPAKELSQPQVQAAQLAPQPQVQVQAAAQPAQPEAQPAASVVPAAVPTVAPVSSNLRGFKTPQQLPMLARKQ